jgi:hypothetical protein
MTMHKEWILLALVLALPGGCMSPREFQQKYPDYPGWGWWDRPAADEPETGKGAAAETDDPAPSEETPAPPADAKPVPPQEDDLVRHRARVWRQVEPMRSFDALPKAEQDRLLDNAKGQLKEWYQPLDVTLPDLAQPDGINTLIWDFMPDEEFFHAAEVWRAIAAKEGRDFPKIVTRRELMRFVEKMTAADAPNETKP